MASTFKTLLSDDQVTSRTLLHEAIPMTGSILSGTYTDTAGTEDNIKTYAHGMFQSVYDYPYLSSSANHIFDITYGHSSTVSSSAAGMTQNAKKLNIYNQMAQVLMGYDETGSIKKFDSDGGTAGFVTGGASAVNYMGGEMNQCFFINLSRLLTKDEIKKGTFELAYYNSGTIGADADAEAGPAHPVPGIAAHGLLTLGDFDATNEYRTSPAGDYGLLFTSSAEVTTAATGYQTQSVGLIFYQAGVVVLTSSIFSNDDPNIPAPYSAAGAIDGVARQNSVPLGFPGTLVGLTHDATQGGTIEQLASSLRFRVKNITFNNTIELNSSIYFCRANHNEFNYSANPTYVSGSKLVVKNNATDLPLSYISAVGLYSADNELLAVAKVSEPLRKDPNTELTLRVRLDY